MADITREEIENGMILFCKSGSHAYGLNIENSDLDYKGICIAPKRFYITFKTFEQKDKGWGSCGVLVPVNQPATKPSNNGTKTGFSIPPISS